MRGKKITNDDAFSLGIGGLGTGFGGMLYETEEQNKARKPFNLKTKDFIVDTAFTPDTNTWETGIQAVNFNNNNWIIVEQYEDKELAEKGHKKWIKYMKTKPKKLYDIFSDEEFDKGVNK